jgi:hypothetical protein
VMNMRQRELHLGILCFLALESALLRVLEERLDTSNLVVANSHSEKEPE